MHRSIHLGNSFNSHLTASSLKKKAGGHCFPSIPSCILCASWVPKGWFVMFVWAQGGIRILGSLDRMQEVDEVLDGFFGLLDDCWMMNG